MAAEDTEDNLGGFRLKNMTLTESTTNGAENKANYCESNGILSRCTITKHDKKAWDCRWFSPKAGPTTICIFDRGEDFEYHCDCVAAQHDV